MKNSNFLKSEYLAVILFFGSVFNSPQAALAGCGFLDITCSPGKWTCPIGGCRPSKGSSDSEVGGPGYGRLNRKSRIKFLNQTGETVKFLYVSRSQARSWGKDRLGVKFLRNSYSFNVPVRTGSGCLYDVKAVTRSGRNTIGWNMNLCSQSRIRLN